jgi:hypothetical protein
VFKVAFGVGVDGDDTWTVCLRTTALRSKILDSWAGPLFDR